MNSVLSFHASAFSQLLVASLWHLPDYFYALNSFPARGRECSTASSSGRPKILGRSSTTSSWAWARSSPSRPCSPTSCRRRSTSRRRPSRRGGGRRGRKPTDRETSEGRRPPKICRFIFFQSSTFRHNFYFGSRSRLGSKFFSRFFKNFWRLRRSRIRIINWFFRDSTLTCVCLLWTSQLLSHTCYEQVMSKAALNHESGGRLAGSMFGKFQGVRLILWPISPHYLRVDIKVLA